MRKFTILLALSILSFSSKAQIVTNYNPAIQPTTGMQYFKPAEADLFTGDCMPAFHDGTYYLYWLLDQGHHAGLNGLGGHQWALSTTKDLVNWQHHPIAVGIDEEWEKSICTGSVIFEKDKVYAFYATRVKEGDRVYEQLSYAISEDGGFTFAKQQPNPFYYAPAECEPGHFRDPKVFKDDKGGFHLFVTAYKKNPVIKDMGGYLVHLVSDDLENWKEVAPVLDGQFTSPECADYFLWNGWYYLIWSMGMGDTYYVKSRNPYGPWEYPDDQALLEPWSNVVKTAWFPGDRRIAASFIPYRENDRTGTQWGGNVLLREVIQLKDGKLGTRFVEELLPQRQKRVNNLSPTFQPGACIRSANGGDITIEATDGVGAVTYENMPEKYRITMTITPHTNYHQLGLFLKATDQENGYMVELDADARKLKIENVQIEALKGMNEPMTLDIIANGEYIDVCYNGTRCNINRLRDEKGNKMHLFVKNGSATFSNVEIYEIE